MTINNYVKAYLILEDGSCFTGYSFSVSKPCSGEVVFNTGMVGYPECLTDPSYRGQILALTYPLIGNYGIPAENHDEELVRNFESEKIQVTGLIVSSFSDETSQRECKYAFSHWLQKHEVPAVFGIDTRALTRRLREFGTLLGKIVFEDSDTAVFFTDPNQRDIVSQVSTTRIISYAPPDKPAKKRVILVDCGVKHGIIRSLLKRNVEVVRVPYNNDFTNMLADFHGVVISNGPGNPEQNVETIKIVRNLMELNYPILGICMGNQLLALASGAKTYKMKYGHRSANQPVKDVFENRAFITSQNHGYAVLNDSLPRGFHTWFENLNDGTNEGIRHSKKPFLSVQFHPEASPGPQESNILFDQYVDLL